MKRTGLWRVVVLLGLTMVVGLGAKLESRIVVGEMVDGAEAFLASLSADQRSRATFEFSSEERLRHHFIPPEVFERSGVSLKEMNDEQRARTHDLLSAGLSARGVLTTQQIIEVEGILGRIEGEPRQFRRSPLDYLVSVFGTPSESGTWGWRFEGHHVSLHFTVVDGAVTVSTPTFLGANPAEVSDGPRKGLRPLWKQEDAGRALLTSLNTEQMATATLERVAPGDITTGARPIVTALDPAGVSAADMTVGQRGLLFEVIDSYTSLMADDIAALRLAKIHEAGFDQIMFAWSGGTARGEVAYYRVQGPTFLIEFDNTQANPNHVHTAWRDFDGDLGRDLIAEHMEQYPH